MKFLYIVIITILGNSLFAQNNPGRKYNAFSGTVVFSVEGGMSLAATDYLGVKPDYLGRVMLEFYLPAYTSSSFGLRLFSNAGFLSEEDGSREIDEFRTGIITAGAGVVYTLNVRNFFFPYIFAGAGHLWFSPRNDDGELLPGNRKALYEKEEINYLGEFGMRFLLTENLSLNISTGLQLSPNDYWDDSREGSSNDLSVNSFAGLSFAFFTQTDSDRDGIIDSRDMCPETPRGITVDGSGCPLDYDKDGVPDYKDKCPRTPSGIRVNENGCPEDSDLDGVPDHADLCPRTPPGTEVDNSGCPIDNDRDGIPDESDKCPDTPLNIEVDASGCPLDDDADGVPDYRDKCPSTPAGQRVDKDGCSIQGDVLKIEGTKEILLSSGASFASGSTKILPAAYEQLNKILYEMKEDHGSRWRIEGYTDNVGSESANEKISLQRAQAVLEFFTARGISKERFEIFGFGESNPVASNETEEGRAKNRRVRILRIN